MFLREGDENGWVEEKGEGRRVRDSENPELVQICTLCFLFATLTFPGP